ncbi:hypothetical protein V498_00410 [Pseudogymnoascus sp. VKM F-4517 (FW-2822)]|nr:hypothetical protein V498_00410 [Pseudogymnoascus sp. VKM F-4517 (FW-2822)]
MLFNFSTYALAVFALASSISASIHRPSKNRGCTADQDNAVEWDTTDLSGLVSLHLCPGGATDISQSISVIATSVANSGSYHWRPSRSIKSHKSFTIIIIDSTSHSVSSEDFGISGLGKDSAADGQGYNEINEAASTRVAATHETVAPVMLEHPVVVEHPTPTIIETAAPVIPEHSVVVEHPMPTIIETAAPVMPEHPVVVEHPMPVVETTAPVMPEHPVMPVHPVVVEHPTATVEAAAPVMPEHSVVVEHPMPTIVETAAPVMPEHPVVVEHPMPTTIETAAPVIPEHSVVVEHPMPVVETAAPVMPEHPVMPVHPVVVVHPTATVEAAAPVMPEHSVVVEHPMPSVEAATPLMPEHSAVVEHSVMVEHPVLTIVETAAMGHIIGLASTFTRITVEAHGNTMATAIETAVRPSLTTVIPEESIFSSEAVATEPATVIATESTRFQGNQTAIAVGTTGTNTRVNSPVFTGGATDNVGSGKVYGAIGAAAVGFVIGML